MPARRSPPQPGAASTSELGKERDPVHMELRFPKDLDPSPSCTLGDVLAELEALEACHRAERATPLKEPPPLSDWYEAKPFVMRVDEHDGNDDTEDDNDIGDEENWPNRSMAPTTTIEKSILFELERDHHLRVEEEVRNKLAALEMCHQNEIQRTISAFARLQKNAEASKEMDRRLDTHHLRKIAEIIDKHLCAIQRDHEQTSQLVERRIRNDAAREESKRKEQALKEEKEQQERAKQETEARQKAVAKLAARKLELETAQMEAAAKEAARLQEEAASRASQSNQMNIPGGSMVNNKEGSSEQNAIRKELGNMGHYNGLPGIKVLAANSALEAEAKRLKLEKELPENLHLSKEFSRYDREIAKSITKLSPTVDSVRRTALKLIEALNGHECPRSIACYLFAKKIISIVKSRETTDKSFQYLPFACGYVVIFVTSQVPEAMDYVLAEFHKVCIYTVPKHLQPLNPRARTKDYFKMIGYHEENGKLQGQESYLKGVVAYMKLYAAMLQTEIKGSRDRLADAWKWLAMFLNALPATTATAFALHAFLQMAGFALHKKYGSQFVKILDVISRCFLPALKEQGSAVDAEAVRKLENYLNDRGYLEEPEGRTLMKDVLSARKVHYGFI